MISDFHFKNMKEPAVTNTDLFTPKRSRTIWIVFIILLLLSLAAFILASLVQRDFGRVQVSNVTYPNDNDISIRAKLFVPVGVSAEAPAPGVVYIHGYQNNRETSDAYSIEMARRGFVVLEIDAIGRGNSDNPGDVESPDFDPTYGGRTSFAYLKSLPFVDPDSVGLMGHSLGAEMAYTIALSDPSVKALSISGFAYTTDASTSMPRNMFMIYGKYDEYRLRMTGTRDFEAEWMTSPQTIAVFPVSNPDFGNLYGDFSLGTARQVVMLRTIHLFESHSRAGIAAAVEWMRSALGPDATYWIDPSRQTWEIKEWATLIAMLTGIAALFPLGLLLLRTNNFQSLQGQVSEVYACTRGEFFKHSSVNGLLMWLYLPLIFMLFGLHVYVVKIDKAFPMMMVNGTVWWFVWINIIGFLLLRGWRKRRSHRDGLTWADLGISYNSSHFSLDWKAIGKSAVLAAFLFAFAYLWEYILESIFLVDYRFLFPFASDLTPYRAGMWLLYFPFLLLGFILSGYFLHGQLRLPVKKTWGRTFLSWSLANTLAMIVPLILFLLIQYIPLLTAGIIPFVGPGGVLANFTMSLIHIIIVLVMVTPLSTLSWRVPQRRPGDLDVRLLPGHCSHPGVKLPAAFSPLEQSKITPC
jgi:pimeloyl-ACP methyl ester carboxylesterase